MKRTQIMILLILSAGGIASAATIQYTYDDAGRLTRANYGGGTRIDYTYDANGNLLERRTRSAAENRPPVAADDAYAAVRPGPLTVAAPGVLANDSDPDGDPLVVEPVDFPAHGTVDLNDDGAFVYTPNAGFVGEDTFAYVANDGLLDSAPATVTITVQKGAATVALDGLAQVYDGAEKSVTVTTTPPGLTVIVTYDGLPAPPVNAGTYAVLVVVDDADYTGQAEGDLVLAKAPQAIVFANPGPRVYGETVALLATGGGSGNPVVFAVTAGPATLDEGLLRFTGVGEVTVTASQAGDANHEAAPDMPQTFTVTKATAALILGDLAQVYDGTGRAATAITQPPGLALTITYDGAAEPPVNAGIYALSATVVDANYAGQAEGQLTIAPRPAAVVADDVGKTIGDADPPLTYTVLAGPVAGDAFTGALTRAPGEALGSYAITAGTLALGTNYELTVTPGVLTIHAPDSTPPVLTGLDPANGEAEAPLAAPLLATFSEAVLAGVGSVTLHRAADGSLFDTIPVGDRGTLAIAGNTVTLGHLPFLAGNSYYVLMPAGCLVDAAGNAFAGLADPQAWCFRARPWQVSFRVGIGGHLEGDTDQRVEQGGSTTAVTALPSHGAIFERWSDGDTDNPRTVDTVTSDLVLEALFREAGAVPLPGTFTAVVDGEGVAVGRGWWDFTGVYTSAAAGNPLVLELTHDAKGKLGGWATYTVAKDTVLRLPIKGSVKGMAGNTLAKIALKGANPAKTLSLMLTLNLALDAATRSLIGNLTGSVTLDGAETPVGTPETLPIAAPMDGTWMLRFVLAQNGEACGGTARLALANGNACDFLARGTAAGQSVALRLAAAAVGPHARAIRITGTIMPMEGGWAELQAFSGQGHGQTLVW